MSTRIELEFVRRDKGSEPYALPASRQAYLLRRPDGSYGTAELDWDATLLNDMAMLYRGERDRAAAQRIGDRIAGLLNQMDWGAARARLNEGLASGERVELVIRSFAAELYALPWELTTLDASGQSLGEIDRLLLRYELPAAKAAVESPADPEMGRVLYAWSAAGGAVPYEAHGAAIAGAAAGGGHPFQPATDTVPNASIGRIVEAMRAQPPAVLHLLCHGGTVGGIFGLVLDGTGGGEVVDPGTLRQALAPFLGTLRLVVLSACHGGHSGPAGNHLGSAAQALHRLGIPAVISSRFPLSVPGSIDLVGALWQRLLVDLDSLEDAFLAARTKLEDRTTTLDWASLQLWCHPTHAPDMRPIAVRPYRGLMPFRREDSRFFFGRDEETAEIVQRVCADANGEHGMTIVAGASGSGKSSVVQAGLIPALHARPGERWRVLLMRPGAGPPMATLSRALGDAGAGDPLARVRALLATPEDRLLLLVDQFEEIFTHHQAKSESVVFAKTLWTLSTVPGCAVLLSMRVDFFARCGELVLDEDLTLLRLVYDSRHRVFIGPMDHAGLGAAIRRPPERVGLVLEEGLGEALLREVRDQPAALPLLEYALDLLWTRRDGHVLRHSTFEEVGGVEGALTQTADGFAAGLEPAVLRQVRRLLIEMVEMGGEQSFATRRRVFYDAVCPTKAEDIAAFEAGVEGLVRLHLVVAGEEPTTPPQRWLDLAHEALIRRWKLLQSWIDEDRERALAVRKVRAWTRDLADDPNAVLEGSRLGYAMNLREEDPDALGPDALALIARSQEAFHKKRTRERFLAIGVLVAAVLVAVAMGALGWTAQRAEKEARRSQAAAEGLARRARNATRLSVARTVRDQAPTRALVLLRDVEIDGKNYAKFLDAARWPEEAIILLQRPFSRAIYTGHQQSVTDAEYSEDGAHVLTASQDGTARVWARDNDHPPLVLQHEEPLRRAMYLHDDASAPTRLVTGGARGTVWLWTLNPAGPERTTILQHSDEITDIDSDGHWILTASLDGKVQLLRSPDTPPLVFAHPNAVRSVDTAADGTRIAAACDDRQVYIWFPDTPDRPPLRLRGHTEAALDVDFSPSGDLLVSAGEDGKALLWDGESGALLGRLEADREALVGAEWAPEGDRVLTWSTDGKVRIYERSACVGRPGRPRDCGPAVELDDLHGAISEAAWSNDGRRVLAGSSAGEAAVWHADGERAPMMLPGHTDRIGSAAFSPDDRWVITASNDGEARGWAAEEDPDFLPLNPSPSPILAVDASAQGRIAMATSDGVLLFYEADGTGPGTPVRLTGDAALSIVTWDAAGERVAVSADNGKIYIVTPGARGATAAPAKTIVLDGGRQPMTNVSWSPLYPQDLISTREDGYLFVWHREVDGNYVQRSSQIAASKLWAAEYTFQGNEIIAGTDDGNLYRLPSSLVPPEPLGAPRPSTIYVIAIHPRDTEVAFSTQDGSIWVRSLVDPQAEDIRIGQHNGPAFDLRYTPDGTRILSASYDGTVGLWKTRPAADGTPDGHALRGHSAAVQSVALLPDGQHFVSGAADGTAIVWSLDLFALDTEAVLTEICAASTACLSTEAYQGFLRLEPEEARAEAERCERAMGRLDGARPEDGRCEAKVGRGGGSPTTQ